MLIEDRWNIVLCGGLAAYLLALGLGVGDAGPHAGPYEGQFRLIEDGRHLQEGCAHGVHVPIAAINSDRTQYFARAENGTIVEIDVEREE